MLLESNLQSKKIALIQLFTTIEDENTINKVIKLLEQESKEDWWNTTTNAQKISIENGIKDAEDGKLIPHEEVMETYGKWL